MAMTPHDPPVPQVIAQLEKDIATYAWYPGTELGEVLRAALDLVAKMRAALDLLRAIPEGPQVDDDDPRATVSVVLAEKDGVGNLREVPGVVAAPCCLSGCQYGCAIPEGQTGWRNIATAPKDDDVLLYRDDWGVRAGFWDDRHGWIAVETSGLTSGKMEPTHWMPFPLPPAPLAETPQEKT